MFKAFVRKHIRNLCLKRVRAKKQSFPQCFANGWRLVGHGLQMVEQWLANGWNMAGQWLANGWPSVGQWLANAWWASGWPMVKNISKLIADS